MLEPAGPPVTGDLIRRGQASADSYWRKGPDSPAALPDLNAAIDEAYGYLDFADPLGGRVAALLGWLLGIRHSAHADTAHDRQTGIHLLEEALTFVNLPPIMDSLVRLTLGQLYLSRAMESLQAAGFPMSMIRGAAASPSSSDADAAIACFQAVVDDETSSAEIVTAARAMLSAAETIRVLLMSSGSEPSGKLLGR